MAVLLLTGMRQGELLGLRWQDIDFASKLIHKRNVVYRGQLVAGLKQTRRTGRTRKHIIGMSSLVEHILTQHQETTLYGQSDHFVFCRSNVDKDNPQDHRPLDPDHIRRYVLYPAMKAAKIPIESRGNGLHLFRHTVVSELAKRNGLKAAQDQAGHSDISTTADVYTHIDAEQKLASAKSIQEAFAVALAEPFAKALAEPTAALLLPSVPSSVVN